MDLFYNIIQSGQVTTMVGGASNSPSSLDVGKLASSKSIDVNNIARATSLTEQPPSSNNNGFLNKYWWVIVVVIVLIIISGLVYKFMIEPKNKQSTVNTSSASTTLLTTYKPSNDVTQSSNDLNVVNNSNTLHSVNLSSNTVVNQSNNKALLLQQSTVNGETVTNFKKIDNGIVTTEASPQDLIKIDQIRNQNLVFAEQQRKSALDQADKIKQMNSRLFTN